MQLHANQVLEPLAVLEYLLARCGFLALGTEGGMRALYSTPERNDGGIIALFVNFQETWML